MFCHANQFNTSFFSTHISNNIIPSKITPTYLNLSSDGVSLPVFLEFSFTSKLTPLSISFFFTSKLCPLCPPEIISSSGRLLFLLRNIAFGEMKQSYTSSSLRLRTGPGMTGIESENHPLPNAGELRGRGDVLGVCDGVRRGTRTNCSRSKKSGKSGNTGKSSIVEYKF